MVDSTFLQFALNNPQPDYVGLYSGAYNLAKQSLLDQRARQIEDIKLQMEQANMAMKIADWQQQRELFPYEKQLMQARANSYNRRGSAAGEAIGGVDVQGIINSLKANRPGGGPPDPEPTPEESPMVDPNFPDAPIFGDELPTTPGAPTATDAGLLGPTSSLRLPAFARGYA